MKLFVFVCLLHAFSFTQAQKIRYEVSFPNAVHHEAEISVSAYSIPVGPAIFRMSRSSPGRYATHEFGKNIYNVKAFDRNGKALNINRTEGDVYQIDQQDGFVRVSYTVFANYPDGTYAGIDAESIHLNMPAVFLWLKGAEKSPVEIEFNLPEEKNWTIATQLPAGKAKHSFTAPNLQYFMDSPTKIGELQIREWTVTNPNKKTYTIRLALESNAGTGRIDSFTERLKKIVDAARYVFGETPNYDFGSYTFIASINPWVNGDGMEHRNSTMICHPGELSLNGFDMFDGFAHEFFHCWNVERIRPRTLEPFNFEKSNMSHELWFAEGFTQYYGTLLVVRAGLEPDTAYQFVAGGLANIKTNSIGAKYYSPVQSSEHAVFVDAGVAVDKTNYPNMYTSYYPYGAAIALALDLELRSRYDKTLDQYMQLVWKKFGKTEDAYQIEDLQKALSELTGDRSFASNFFRKYIFGSEPIDYKPLLAKAGFLLKQADGRAWAGNLRFRESEGKVVVNSNPVRETPFYEAGIEIEDQLIELDGKPVAKVADIAAILAARKNGDSINLRFLHRNKERKVQMTLKENPALTAVTYESAGLTVTEEIRRFRNKWLLGK